MQVLHRPPSGWPALVLNADFRPLSYYPLSLWPWEEAVKAVYQDRVEVVSLYDKVVRSPSMEMQLPSVIALKSYVDQDRSPAFTRFNVFLRDGFACQYCGEVRSKLRLVPTETAALLLFALSSWMKTLTSLAESSHQSTQMSASSAVFAGNNMNRSL